MNLLSNVHKTVVLQDVGCTATTWDMYDTYKKADDDKKKGMISASLFSHHIYIYIEPEKNPNCPSILQKYLPVCSSNANIDEILQYSYPISMKFTHERFSVIHSSFLPLSQTQKNILLFSSYMIANHCM